MYALEAPAQVASSLGRQSRVTTILQVSSLALHYFKLSAREKADTNTSLSLELKKISYCTSLWNSVQLH